MSLGYDQMLPVTILWGGQIVGKAHDWKFDYGTEFSRKWEPVESAQAIAFGAAVNKGNQVFVEFDEHGLLCWRYPLPGNCQGDFEVNMKAEPKRRVVKLDESIIELQDTTGAP